MSNTIISHKKFIDEETGEIKTFLVIAPKEVDTKFVKVFIPFIEEVVSDSELIGKAFRLLLWVIKNLNWNDLSVVMNAKMVSKDLSIHRATYFNWLKVLLDRGILTRHPESKETFYLKPHSVVMGSMKKVNKPAQKAGLGKAK